MGTITNPATFSGHFGLDPDKLVALDVLDVTLATDTRLFMDPLLFESSQHQEFADFGVAAYRHHFETVIKFLERIEAPQDLAWRTARGLLSFREIEGTCLGYGTNSINGSGWGPDLTRRAVSLGLEIVRLGVTDPDLFLAMALFEEGFGPDRISDMATRVVIKELELFNGRVLDELGMAGGSFYVADETRTFLTNPFSKKPTPIILVPRDILRPLPIANDWDGVRDAAATNESLRNRVNKQIGEIWESKSKRDKAVLRKQAMSSVDAFETLIDAIRGHKRTLYDIQGDPEGLLRWAVAARNFTEQYPMALAQPTSETLDAIDEVVTQIIQQFRQLVEHNGLNKELFANGKARHESSAQRLFFAVAHSYCNANDLDISPEADSGNGPVDFKFSTGFKSRVLVEVKLSTNNKMAAGYQKQLEAYKAAEQTQRAHFLVMDVGSLGNKLKQVEQLRKDALAAGNPLSPEHVIDAKPKPSASKL